MDPTSALGPDPLGLSQFLTYAIYLIGWTLFLSVGAAICDIASKRWPR